MGKKREKGPLLVDNNQRCTENEKMNGYKQADE